MFFQAISVFRILSVSSLIRCRLTVCLLCTFACHQFLDVLCRGSHCRRRTDGLGRDVVDDGGKLNGVVCAWNVTQGQAAVRDDKTWNGERVVGA